MGIPLETCNTMFKGIFLVAAFGISFAAPQREGKLFSLFNVVTFKNDDCVSTSTSMTSGHRNGTCYTAQECTKKKGTASGGCAMGFGTCCVFTEETCGNTVKQNNSYVRNKNFPTVLTGTTSTTLAACTFSVSKMSSDVCTIRLDFNTFQIVSGTYVAQTSNVDSHAICQDSFTVTSTNRPGIPVICGKNTGHHMYYEVGADTTSTLGFTFGTKIAGTRTFEIKVTQYTCDSMMRPPEGCLQYFMGTEGRLETFNFEENKLHLPSQEYSICIRQEKGFCCTSYSVCSDANSFTLDRGGTANLGLHDASCTSAKDFIEIPGSSNICGSPATFTRYCGERLSTNAAATTNSVICDCTPPFIVGIRTNAASNTEARQSRGICLNFHQSPC